MKTKILALSVIALLSTLGSLNSQAALKRGDTLRVATEGQFAPFNFFEKDKLTGFEVELADAIAHDMGLKTDWKAYPFDSLLIGLGQNKYDLVIASHGITDERAKAVDFSPHYCTGAVIMAKAGGPKTVSDLNGKTVAVEVGTTYLTKVQEIKTIGAVKSYPKDTDSLQNLLAGRADAWVTDKFVGIEMLKKQKGLQMGDMLYTEKVGMAVSKGNADLLKTVNTSLEHVLKNGTYAKLSNKYFGQDIRCAQ